MLELVIVLLLAAIGVAITTHREDRHTVRVRRRRLSAADDRAETLGIFGHDVGPRGMPASASASVPEAAWPPAPGRPARAPGASTSPPGRPAGDGPGDRWQQRRLLPPSELPLDESWNAPVGPAPGQAELRRAGTEGLPDGSGDLFDSEVRRDALTPEEEREAFIATAEVPVIRDFDPRLDRIVLECGPGKMGDAAPGVGRDPARPGAAMITLDDRLVAVVEGADGLVTPAHVEIVREEPGKAAVA